MTEKIKEKLRQGNSKYSKGAKICASIKWEIVCEKCSKNFSKIFGRQIWKIKKNTKYFSNPNVVFKSAKNSLEKCNPKEDIAKTTISKVLSKTFNRKKTSKQHYNFYKAKISLEVHGM